MAIPGVLASTNNLTLQGEELAFFWEKREAFLKDAHMEYGGLFLYAPYLSLERGKITLKDAYFTTCNLPHPHYKVATKYLVLPIEGERRKLYAKGIALYIGERKIFSLPPFRASLNPKQREREGVLAIPRVEFNKDMGFSLREELTFSFREDNGRLKIGYSTKRGLLCGFSLPILPYTTLKLSRYEEISGKRISPLYISEVPHILWEYGGCSLSLGKFEEEPTHRRSSRLAISLSHPILKENIGSALSLELLGKGNYSLYDEGERYSSVGGELSFRKEGKSSGAILSFGYLALGGSTPFVFDKEELTSYIRFGLTKDGRKWQWEVNMIGDLKTKELYDVRFTLYKKLHCLEPGVSWQKRGGILQFQLKLLGF